MQTELGMQEVAGRNVLALAVEGEVGAADAVGVVRQVAELVDATTELIYVRVQDVQLGQLGRAELRDVADTWRRGPIPGDLPIVVVASDAVAYGVVRIVLALGRNDNARAFRNAENAETWIEGLPAR